MDAEIYDDGYALESDEWFTRLLRCPHCGKQVRVRDEDGLLWLPDSWLTCPYCKRCSSAGRWKK